MAVIKTTGGYNALPISYKRGNPIPLDKSSVWYNYDLMVAYATTDPTAYVGQILSLVDETDKTAAKAYIILNVAGDIEEIGSGSLSTAIDSIELRLDTIDNSIESISESITNLNTLVGAPADDDTDASGIFAELDKKANAADVYTKEETNTQINTAVANVAHLKRKEVASVELINVNADDAEQYIYMVPSGLTDDDNKYYEYMVMEIEVADSEGVVTKVKQVEQVGSWAIDLSEYAKVSAVTAEKQRAEAAEQALATSISNLQNRVADTETDIENLQTDVNDLETDLDTKVDKVYYTVENEDGTTSQVEGTLLTPEEKTKLAGLSVNPDGSVGISGTVNADNVQGLGTWIAQNGSTYIQNLTEDNLSQDIVDKLNYITAVDGTNFTVTNGTLYLNEIAAEKVTGLPALITKVGNLETSLKTLEDAVNDKTSGLSAVNARVLTLEQTVEALDDNYVTVVNFNKTVGDLNTLLQSSNGTIIAQIEDINTRLTWQELDSLSE